MSYNNENDLETLNILMISYAALGRSEIAVQGALKSCISLDPFNNFVCTLVQQNQCGMALYTTTQRKILNIVLWPIVWALVFNYIVCWLLQLCHPQHSPVLPKEWCWHSQKQHFCFLLCFIFLKKFLWPFQNIAATAHSTPGVLRQFAFKLHLSIQQANK